MPNCLSRVLVFLIVALGTALPAYSQRVGVKPSSDGDAARRSTEKQSRPRVASPSNAEELAAQNPFAARANREVRPSQTETSAGQTPTMVPRANQTETTGVDTLVLRDGSRLEGAITRFSGAGGATIMVGDREHRVEFARIERLDANVSETFVRAVEAFEAGRRSGLDSEYRRALALFKESRASAERSFEKEWATAKIVEALLALGRQDEAIVEFFILCRLDPYTAFLSSIPLLWQNQRSARTDAAAARNAQETAALWLDPRDNPTNAPNPVGRLLAASTLMRSAKHGAAAVAALRELGALEPPDDADPDMVETCRLVSLLALAQLWRDDVLKKPEQKVVDRWIRVLELFPNAYKPGPAALIALGEKALRNDAEAARYFTLAGMLTNDRALAIECLGEACDAYERQGLKKPAEKLRAFLAKENVQSEQR